MSRYYEESDIFELRKTKAYGSFCRTILMAFILLFFRAVNYGASVFRECRFFIVEIGLGRVWNEISGRLSGKD